MARAWGPGAILLALAMAFAPAAQAVGDETPPPTPPLVDVPPLVSPPVEIPPSTMPTGDFTGIQPSTPDPPTEGLKPPDLRPLWETLSPEQLAYLSGLGAGLAGHSIVIFTGQNGEMIIQNIDGESTVGMEPSPELASLSVSRKGVVLFQGPSAPSQTSVGDDVRLAVPKTTRVSFSVTNRSPESAHVFISWVYGRDVVSQSRLLGPGENWTGDLDAVGAAAVDGVLIVASRSTGRFEDNVFGVAALASDAAK